MSGGTLPSSAIADLAVSTRFRDASDVAIAEADNSKPLLCPTRAVRRSCPCRPEPATFDKTSHSANRSACQAPSPGGVGAAGPAIHPSSRDFLDVAASMAASQPPAQAVGTGPSNPFSHASRGESVGQLCLPASGTRDDNPPSAPAYAMDNVISPGHRPGSRTRFAG